MLVLRPGSLAWGSLTISKVQVAVQSTAPPWYSYSTGLRSHRTWEAPEGQGGHFTVHRSLHRNRALQGTGQCRVQDSGHFEGLTSLCRTQVAPTRSPPSLHRVAPSLDCSQVQGPCGAAGSLVARLGFPGSGGSACNMRRPLPIARRGRPRLRPSRSAQAWQSAWLASAPQRVQVPGGGGRAAGARARRSAECTRSSTADGRAASRRLSRSRAWPRKASGAYTHSSEK